MLPREKRRKEKNKHGLEKNERRKNQTNNLQFQGGEGSNNLEDWSIFFNLRGQAFSFVLTSRQGARAQVIKSFTQQK